MRPGLCSGFHLARQTPRDQPQEENNKQPYMDQALLQALEGFFIGAIPTIIFIFLLFVAYRSLVHVPLQKVLQQRYERTEGAMVRAQADIAAAAAKAAEYELRLREARQSVFKAQEARRQKLAQARETALQQTRARAQEMVKEARTALELEVVEARKKLQQDAQTLAAEVVRTILKPVSAAPVGGRS